VSESTCGEIIKLVKYDPIWAIAYQQERELITTALKQEVTDIQHIGTQQYQA